VSEETVTLVTGGAGFLGSHLCDRFLGEGHKVVAMDNFLSGSRDNIAHLSDNPHFSLIEHDISKTIDFPGRLDNILHFASPASPTDYLKLPIQTLKVGSLGTHNVLGLAKAKDSRILLASTSEVYGDPLEHPQKESYWGNVNPVGYRGVYDEAKRFSEAMVMAYHRTHGVKTRIVRIFNTFGPRMRLDDGRGLPNFMKQGLLGQDITIYGDGSQTRSFQYVDDLIDGLLLLLNSEESMPVNIGNPHEISIKQLAEEILDLTGNKSSITYQPLPHGFEDDPKVRRPDTTRAREILGWEPKIDRQVGLSRTLENFRERLL
jgi:dTDP-glucose 4,6-dehydratase